MNVSGHPELKRDIYSGAIVNDSTTEYEKYMDTMRIKNSQNKKIDRLENEVNEIKNELSDIKTLLVQILNK